MSRYANTLPTHPVALALDVFVVTAKHEALRQSPAALPPLELEMGSAALEPTLRSSPAVAERTIHGTPCNLMAWQSGTTVRVAVIHRRTGRTYAAQGTDKPNLARLSAYAGSLIAQNPNHRRVA